MLTPSPENLLHAELILSQFRAKHAVPFPVEAQADLEQMIARALDAARAQGADIARMEAAAHVVWLTSEQRVGDEPDVDACDSAFNNLPARATMNERLQAYGVALSKAIAAHPPLPEVQKGPSEAV